MVKVLDESKLSWPKLLLTQIEKFATLLLITLFVSLIIAMLRALAGR